MFTSYFAEPTLKVTGGLNLVSIAGRAPAGFKGREYKKLAPKYWFWKKYDETKDAEAYKKHYKEEVLDKLDPQKVYDELGKNATLLCWEKAGKFCHRRLVAEWLEEHLGIKVPEYTTKIHVVPGRLGVLHTDCEDYNVGTFVPVSFESKLNWKIDKSEPDEKLELSRHIKFSAFCFNGDLLVGSHPFAGGVFYLDHYELGLRTKHLGTTDPEEALYLAEQFIKNYAKTSMGFFQRLLIIFGIFDIFDIFDAPDITPTVGREEQAIRWAYNNFEEWHNKTNVPDAHSDHYYEILKLIEESTQIGFGAAFGQSLDKIKQRFDKE